MRFALSLLLLASLPGTTQAQTLDDLLLFGHRAPASGPRLTAMGGAALAGLGDWDATYANPAGLAYLRSAQAVVSGEAFVAEPNGYAASYLDGDEGAVLATAGYAAPLPVVRGALAFGGGYRTTAHYLRVTEEADGTARREAGWQGELSVAGATALAPRLMAGLAVNAPVGHYERASHFGGSTDEGHTYHEVELAGVNVRAGLSAALNYGVRLGFIVETPTWLRLDQQGDTGSPEGGFEGLDRAVVVQTPWRVGMGFLVGGPGVLVSADVEVVDWSQARFVDTREPDLLDENAFADAYLGPVLNTRIGVEGLVGPVALRAGAAFQPDPRYVGPTPEVIRQTYAVGVGVPLHPQARLDLAVVHVRDDWASPFSILVGDGVGSAAQIGLDVRF